MAWSPPNAGPLPVCGEDKPVFPPPPILSHTLDLVTPSAIFILQASVVALQARLGVNLEVTSRSESGGTSRLNECGYPPWPPSALKNILS